MKVDEQRAEPRRKSRPKLMVRQALTLVSCLAGGPALAGVEVVGAYAHATLPGQSASAVYFTLTNSGSAPAFLIDAFSPVTTRIELHGVSSDGQATPQRSIARISIPAGQSLSFHPEGPHLLLMGLETPLVPGDEIPLTLTFSDQQLDVRVQVDPVVITRPGMPSIKELLHRHRHDENETPDHDDHGHNGQH